MKIFQEEYFHMLPGIQGTVKYYLEIREYLRILKFSVEQLIFITWETGKIDIFLRKQGNIQSPPLEAV